MKKSLIALAALAATSAFAQSSVTLYGIVEATVDVGYNRTIQATSNLQGFNGAGVAVGTVVGNAPGIGIVVPGAAALINPSSGNLTLGTSPFTQAAGTGVITVNAASSTGTTVTSNVRKNGFRVQDGNDQGTGTSRVGFRGTEDLGGGLKANFLMEIGLRIDDGAAPGTAGVNSSSSGGNIFGRNAWGGISSPTFGEVRLGRQVLGSFGVQANSWAAGSSNGLYDAGSGTAPLMGGVRFSNAIRYMTPDFGGFKGSLMFAAPETDADTATSSSAPSAASGGNLVTTTGASRRTGVDLALEYANGPAYIGFGYNKRDAASGTNGSNQVIAAGTPALGNNVLGGSITGYTIGGSYDLGVVRPFINYTRETQNLGSSSVFTGATTATNTSLVTNGNASTRAYSIGLRAPLGATTLIASYGNAKVSATGSTVASEAAGTRSFNQTLSSSRNAFQVGAQYSLSKRTMLEANYGYNKVTIDATGRTGSSVAISTDTAVSTARTNDRISAFNVGLRHSF